MKTLITIIFTALILSSCHHVQKGHISEKEYEPARTYIAYMPMRAGKVTMMVPYTIYDNEDYILTVEGNDEDGELMHEHIYVTKEYYNSLKVGDQWCRTDDCSYSDENNNKVRK